MIIQFFVSVYGAAALPFTDEAGGAAGGTSGGGRNHRPLLQRPPPSKRQLGTSDPPRLSRSRQLAFPFPHQHFEMLLVTHIAISSSSYVGSFCFNSFSGVFDSSSFRRLDVIGSNNVFSGSFKARDRRSLVYICYLNENVQGQLFPSQMEMESCAFIFV